MAGSPTLQPVIKIDGAEPNGEFYNIVSTVHVSRSFGSVAHARLTYRMTTDDADPGITIGKQLTIGVSSDSAASTWSTPIFTGSIVGLGVALDAGTSQTVTVDAYDHAYKLSRKSMVTTFEDQQHRDVIARLASECGLTSQVPSGLGGTAPRYFQQFATAHQYLNTICHASGCEWLVDDRQLVIRPRSGGGRTVELKAGVDLRNFEVRYSVSDQVDKVTVNGWDPRTKQQIVGEAMSKGDDSGVVLSGFAKNLPKQSGVGGTTVVSIPRPVLDQNDADALATGIVRQREASLLRGRGEVAVPSADIVPGAKLQVSGMVVEAWNGTYYCTEVEHSWSDGTMRTRFEVGGVEPTGLVDLFGVATHPTLDKMLSGLTIGIVTNNNDDKGGGLNRVRVKFPYLSEQLESAWARVLQPGAGSGRGFLSMPEVDDEVLVGFEHGDINHPFVLGGLWNGKGTSNYAVGDFLEDGKVKNRAIRTRLGHELLLSDGNKDGSQFVSIITAKGKSNLKLAEDMITITGDKIPVTVKVGSGTIEISESGDITIKAPSITLDSSGAVTIKGASVDIEGTQGKVAAHTGAGDIELKGLNAVLEGSINTTIKGNAGVAIN